MYCVFPLSSRSGVAGSDLDETFALSAATFWQLACSKEFYCSTRQHSKNVRQKVDYMAMMIMIFSHHERLISLESDPNRLKKCTMVQGASLSGRHTPPATLAQEGKIVV